MSSRRMTGWLGSLILSILAVGPAAAQTSGEGSLPGSVAPSGPDNPYVPPSCAGNVFADVTCSTPFDAWIEQYAADEITGGCGGGLYCPNSPVTRAQMAVFVEKAMRGTDTWNPGDLGGNNTGLGEGALYANTRALGNTALGASALVNQSFDNGGFGWSTYNTAVGVDALFYNQPTNTSNGRENTAVGANALTNNTTGFYNTAVGSLVLGYNETGFRNTAIGWHAGARGGDVITGYSGSNVTFINNHDGLYNTFIGPAGSTTEVNNCTAVGMDAYCSAADQVRLGNFFVTPIGGKVAWSTLSDARAKSDVRELDYGLDLVLALKPVSYRYKGGNGRTDMGFVAQDVEKLLDGYNVVDAGGDSDRTLSLRYTELIAPLVKAVQEQQSQIEALREEIRMLRASGARSD